MRQASKKMPYLMPE